MQANRRRQLLRQRAFISALSGYWYNTELTLPKRKADFILRKGGMSYTIGSGDYLYICAKAEKNNGFTELRLTKLDAPADGSAADTAQGYIMFQSAASMIETSTDHELLDRFNTFSMDEDEGYYLRWLTISAVLLWRTGVKRILRTSASLPILPPHIQIGHRTDGQLLCGRLSFRRLPWKILHVGLYDVQWSWSAGRSGYIDYSFRYTCSRRSVILRIGNIAPTVSVGAFVIIMQSPTSPIHP